jgi:hypothetical protein
MGARNGMKIGHERIILKITDFFMFEISKTFSTANLSDFQK